ncbi:MAG: hypothetical protein O2968_17680 [Acidobacteria bacterium]|nr:hypothetical protein [Acidobacteriota bacterium]
MAKDIPHQFIDVIGKAIDTWVIEPPQVLRILTDGESGAFVAIAHIRSREGASEPVPSGEYILKLDSEHKWDPPEPSEWQRHKHAEGRSEPFARRHIPTLLRHVVSGEKIAMLYDLAGRGVSNLLTPDSLDARSLILQGAQIAQSLLFDLNASSREVSPCSPSTTVLETMVA